MPNHRQNVWKPFAVTAVYRTKFCLLCVGSKWQSVHRYKHGIFVGNGKKEVSVLHFCKLSAGSIYLQKRRRLIVHAFPQRFFPAPEGEKVFPWLQLTQFVFREKLFRNFQRLHICAYLHVNTNGLVAQSNRHTVCAVRKGNVSAATKGFPVGQGFKTNVFQTFAPHFLRGEIKQPLCVLLLTLMQLHSCFPTFVRKFMHKHRCGNSLAVAVVHNLSSLKQIIPFDGKKVNVVNLCKQNSWRNIKNTL